MKIEHFKAYNQIHTWTGIISGIFLFICFVAGALTMFKMPLNQWALQESAMLPKIAIADYDRLIQSVLHEYPEAHHEMTVHLPRAQPQSAPVSWLVEDHETHTSILWHASFNSNGELIAEQATVSAIGEFMDHLHRTAGIPGGTGHDVIGTYVMGIVAVLYFLALVSGLVIFLPSWIKDFLTLRRGKNQKRYWVDFHNVLGITAFPFHLVIALTTIVFAYHDIFYDSLRSMVYQETPMFGRPPPQPPEQNFSDLASVQLLSDELQALEPGFEIAELRYSSLGSPRARLVVGGELDGGWIRGAHYAYAVSDPYTGEPGYTAMLPSQSGVMGKIVSGFFALHFGGFGGETVRWIYFGLGLSGALLFLTGNILWIETRRKRRKDSDGVVREKQSTIVMARLTVGACLGCLIGIVLAFICAKWLPHTRFDIASWQKLAYYSGFLGAVAWAFLQSPLRAMKQLLAVLCVLLSLLVVSGFWQLSNSGISSIELGVIAVVIMITGGLLATIAHLRERTVEMSASDSVWV